MNPPKMPIHIGDLLRDTGHLRAAGTGAYLLLLFHHWSTGSLPDDDDQLSAIAKMSPTEWRKSKPILEKFFQPGWRHGRVEKDLESAKQSYEARAKAGQKGGKAKAEAKQSSSIATAEPEQPLTFNQGTKEERSSSLRSERTRGARLPENWEPSPQDRVTAQALIGDGIAGELDKFRDHWKQQPGSKGVKLDWDAAWRNWTRRAAEFGGRNGHRTGNTRPSGHDAILAVATRKARELDRNDAMAGGADAAGFAGGDGIDPGGSERNSNATGSGQRDHHGQEPDDKRIREGEIIPPDKNAAGVPRGREFV